MGHHHHDSTPSPGPRKQHHSSDSASSSSSDAASAISRAKKKSRYPVEDDGDEDRMECSGKYCRSCSAGIIADCVALCCCPCALVNLLTLALVKVPWMVGRKCLGLGNSKSKKINNQGQNGKSRKKCNSKKKMPYCESFSQRQWGYAAEELPAQVSGYVIGFDDRGEEEEEEEDCASSAERVWWELYQVGHLGFGRVSFSGGGTQQSKGNLGT